MPWKLSFLFVAGQTGWSESYYRDRATPQTATTFTADFWNAFFIPRGDSVVCRAIRVSDPDVPRSGTLIVVDKRRTTVGLLANAGDEPVQVAAQLAATTALPSRRTILVRGLRDLAYIRDSSGVYNPNETTKAWFNAFAIAIRNAELQLRHLEPHPAPNPDKPVVSLQSDMGGAATRVFADPLVLPNVGQRVIFHRLPTGLFPGLRGEVPVIARDAAGSFLLPVRWTGPTNSVTTPGAVFRVPFYNYGPIISAPLKDIRARRTGRPSDLSRGRRSAVRYRPR